MKQNVIVQKIDDHALDLDPDHQRGGVLDPVLGPEDQDINVLDRDPGKDVGTLLDPEAKKDVNEKRSENAGKKGFLQLSLKLSAFAAQHFG